MDNQDFTQPSAATPAPVFPTQGSSNPAPVFPTAPPASPVPYTDNQLNVTSSLAALANQRNRPDAQYKTMYELTEEAKDRINNGEEDQMRQEISDSKKTSDIQREHDLQSDLLNASGIGPEKSMVIKDSMEREGDIAGSMPDHNTLEKEGISEIQQQASQNTTQAIVQARQLQKKPSAFDDTRDHLTFATAWNKAIDQVQQEVHNEGWGEYITDFFSLPLQQWWTNAHAVPKTSFGATPARTLENSLAALNKMPLNERLAAIPTIVQNVKANSGLFTVNNSLALTTLEGLRSIDVRDTMSANFWAATDVASNIGFAKYLKAPWQIMMAAGSRSAAVDSVASDLIRSAHGVEGPVGGIGPIHTGTNIIEAAIPDQFKSANLIGPGPGIANSVAKRVKDSMDAIQETIRSLGSSSRKTPDQITELANAQAKRFELRLSSDNIINVANEGWVFGEDVLPEDLDKYRVSGPVAPGSLFQIEKDQDTGLHYLSAYVGDFKGYGGTSSRELTEAGIKARGWDPNVVKAVEMPDGQWAAKVTQVVREDGVFTPEMKTADRPWGRVAEFSKNANDMRDEYFQGAALRQVGVESGIWNKVMRPLIKNVQAVGARSRKILQAVVDLGNQEIVEGQSQPGKWYNWNEFNTHFERISGRPPTEKEALSYYSLKQMRDTEHYMRNRGLFIDKARRGIETVRASNDAIKFDSGRLNGRILNNSQLNSVRFMDVDSGTHWAEGKAGELSEKLDAGTHRLIEFEEPVDYKGEKVKYALAHKDMSSSGPLDFNQLEYVGGTPTKYRGKFFTKQAQSYSAGGNNYWLNPLTHAVHLTRDAADKYAGSLEAARKAYHYVQGEISTAAESSLKGIYKKNAQIKAFKSAIAQTEEVFANSPLHDYENFTAAVKDGSISVDHPFESLYENSMPTAMGNEPYMQWFDTDRPAMEQLHITRKGMFYSPRGQHLLDENGKLAPVIDPWKTTQLAIQNAVRTHAWQNYNMRVMEEWVQKARDAKLFDENSAKMSNTTEAFLHGKLNKAMLGTDENQALARTLEMNRTLHMRLLNLSTEEQSTENMYARRFASWIDGHGKVSDMIATKALEMQDIHPLAALKALAYNSTIAMFAPARFVIHTTTSAAALTIHPVYGIHATLMTWPIRLLGFNRGQALLDHIAGWGKTVTGFEPDSFKMMMQSLRNTGRMYMGDATSMLEDMYPGKIGGGRISSAASKIARGGQVFFNEAERINQIVGWQLAWRDALDVHPELAEGSEKFTDYVLRKADVLTNNMSKASRAEWQKSVLGLPGQFHTLQARMIEKMLPEKLGGNSLLSGTQRMRLVIGQLAMYGSAGAPGAAYLSQYAAEQYQKANGAPLSPDKWRLMSQGLVDSALFGLSGGRLDTNWASRVGIGSTLSDFADGSNQGVLELLGGPSFEVGGRMANSILSVMSVMRAAQVTNDFTEQDFDLISEDLAKNLPVFNEAEKSYYIFRYGQLRNPQTGRPLVSVDKLNGVASALGIPLRQDVNYWQMLRKEEEWDQLVRKQAQITEGIERRAYEALAQPNGYQEAQNWFTLLKGLMAPFGDNPTEVRQITQERNRISKRGADDYDALVARIYNETGQMPLGEPQ